MIVKNNYVKIALLLPLVQDYLVLVSLKKNLFTFCKKI